MVSAAFSRSRRSSLANLRRRTVGPWPRVMIYLRLLARTSNQEAQSALAADNRPYTGIPRSMDCNLHEMVVCSLVLNGPTIVRNAHNRENRWPGAIFSSLHYRRACIVDSTKLRTRYTRPHPKSRTSSTISASHFWLAHCARSWPNTAPTPADTALCVTAGVTRSRVSVALFPAGPTLRLRSRSYPTSRGRYPLTTPRVLERANACTTSYAKTHALVGRAAHNSRISPSCTTVAIYVPSRENSRPVAKARAFDAVGEALSYRNHSSARNGR